MAEGKPSTLVMLLLVVLHLIAFGFAIAAERRRSKGRVIRDTSQNDVSYCVYNSDIATGYGVGAFLFLFLAEFLIMGVTKCMCCGGALTPGGSRAWAIIYFFSSWLTFLIAEACLVAGAAKNAYHTKYRNMIYADKLSCETLRKGVFAAGAAFVVITLFLSLMYYAKYAKARDGVRKPTHAQSNVGMTSL
uniref:TSA: Wollemia nobilis Ref_Wollemi_Transcript_15501_1024 transcribed RNA sequence n=1 Tax=Wollemia nobilis TaxID=56998 RepID=A0A0C9S659_9CONI